MTMQGIAKEFPDFPIAYAPELPDGWVDTSWHHDESPSYSHNGLQVFIIADGEFRYVIMDVEDGETVLMTNNWKDCMVYVNSYWT
jgi:hypothetical protein